VLGSKSLACCCVRYIHLRCAPLPRREVKEESIALGARFFRASWNRNAIADFKFPIVNSSSHDLVSGIKYSKAILICKSAIRRVRHGMLLINLVVIFWRVYSSRAYTFISCSLNQLVRVLVTVPEFVIYVNFRVSESLSKI